ncbi:MAG: DsrE/DsrF/DrsH-like family protein [Planctomycetota bacterium]|nr:DsrE/DsrF/DrsH-like family protein [Planctomycetota bacterium]
MTQGKRMVIIGGVAGGASCAARARRLSEDAEIVLVERGEHVSFANCGMPYHLGGAIADRGRLLVQTAAGLTKRYRLDVRVRTEALAIDRANKTVTLRDLATGRDYAQPYDVLVLSPGAEPVRPPIPGVDTEGVMTLRSLKDMDAIAGLLGRKKLEHALIVGGGYIGLGMAEALRNRGLGVTLAELADQVFGAADPEMAAPVRDELIRHGVRVLLETSVANIAPAAEGVSVTLSTGETLACGLVLLAVGVKPEVGLAKQAGLAIGAGGGIVVDEHMRTADPSIYAVGDAVEVSQFVGGAKGQIPLAGPANRQGRIAADNAFGRESVYRDTQGTAICKIFDVVLGMTGLSEKQLARSGRKYEKIYVHPASHAGYYPGAAQMSLKLLFDPGDGRILGAQAVGGEGIDKRIDVLAVAIRAGMTVHDLKDLELSYAPPYGSAKDAVNYAGFVASGVLDGDVSICHVADVTKRREDQVLLDVRTADEAQAGTIPGARNIPVDELRARLGELPREKELLVFCQVGLRGYVACRILSQRGFRCRNLSGGYKTYKAFTGPAPVPPAGAKTEKNEMTNDTGADAASRAPQDQKLQSVKEVDARGLACPGPIMKLKAELAPLAAGQGVRILATDPGFGPDVAAWCHSTGNQLADLTHEGGSFAATVVRREQAAAIPCSGPGAGGKNKTIVLFSGDFDKAMAAFIIANGAAAMGSAVTIFCTFWGLNVIRRGEKVRVRKNLIERMFGWMMPRGVGKLTLSRMNMGGMGTAMIKGIMKKKNVSTLAGLIESARAAGVRLVACTMSMDLMGIHKEELLDGVEEGGVAMYLDQAEGGNVNLFI